VYQGFRLTKRNDYIWVSFDHFKSSSIFGSSWAWGSFENWLKPKTKPSLENLACQNP
jgi:hypothetical protein